MTLDQLSAAATEAMDKAMRLIDEGAPQPAISKASFENTIAHEKLAHALVNAYRAGQLVAVADDAIERVASVLDPDAMDMTQPCAFRENRKSLALEQAHKAIAAMKDTQP